MDQYSSNSEKVAFFRSMFVGRKNVFARLFESAKTGKKGYSPYCENLWVRGVCGLLKGWKCSDCPSRKFVAYSNEVVCWHLRALMPRISLLKKEENSAIILQMVTMVFFRGRLAAGSGWIIPEVQNSKP